MNKLAAGMFIAVLLGAAPGMVSQAGAAPEVKGEAAAQAQAAAVQSAEYVDENGNTVAVTTFADGSIAVSVNGGAPVMGAKAMEVLAAHGVSLSVAPTGQITAQSVSGKTSVKVAPHAATPAEAAAAKAAAPAEAADAKADSGKSAPAEAAAPAVVAPAPVANVAMPSNVATGSGMGNTQNAADNGNTSFSQNNINEKPISR